MKWGAAPVRVPTPTAEPDETPDYFPRMPRTLLIVESPNKARKIQSFLGRDVTVRASVGHVCDLPQKEYGVDLDTLEERYEVRNAKVVGELRALVKSGSFETVLLGTDPDREGEAIAWHLARELRLGRGERRVEFREVTAAAVRAALARPRAVDLARVDAQRSRRVLDRVVGFDVSSEICWPAGASSAGRVQTPALHLLCEREREILAFVAERYWTLGVRYGEGFEAVVPERASASAAATEGESRDGEARDGREERRASSVEGRPGLRAHRFPTREEAERTRELAKSHDHVVRSVDRRRTPRRPEPPYTTSTLQQDASRKLRLSAKQAADQAQALFEAGYITYHRTDSTRVGEEAAAAARALIGREHPDALPAKPPVARGAAGAQDAHEAIRPTQLEGDGSPPPGTERLYALIKARFLASQCKPALFDRTTVWIDSGPVAWAAEGAVLVEPGFLHYWRPYARQEDTELPEVAPGQRLHPERYQVQEKQTTPPPRYDTGALIRKLELSGIGRPATFASIIDTLLRRGYAVEVTTAAARGAAADAADAADDADDDAPPTKESTKEPKGAKGARGGKRVLQPTTLGLQVDGLLTASFPTLVTEGYTAGMEAELDRIERREGETRPGYLKRWYADFRREMTEALDRAAAYRAEHGLNGRTRGAAGGGGARGEETAIRCDRCGEASYRKIARRGGKGSFLACPACRLTRDVRARTKPNGCPKCGSTLVERRGKKKGVRFFGCVRYGADERPCDHLEFSDDARPGERRASSSTAAPSTAAPSTAAPDATAPSSPAAAPAKRAGKRAAGGTATATRVARVAKAGSPAERSRGAASSVAEHATRVATTKRCPSCERAMLDVVTPAQGAPSYGCQDATCGFALPVGARRRASDCPRCGGVVLEQRRSREWACARRTCGWTAPLPAAAPGAG